MNSPEGQRFTPLRPDSHRGIYASTTLLTAGAEFAGSVAKWELGDCANAVIFTMVARLKSLLDLWDPKVREQLGTTRAELQSPWLGYFKMFGTWPPTWTLGKAVFDSGRFDGIRFFSNRNAPNGRNALVFTDRLDGSESYVRIYDQNGSLLESIPPSF
ncbi:MAG: RES domain-containing protein [Acidobacteriota bacterium]